MSGDNERVSVQTYVTADQRDTWREEADELDMTQAEYVRSMVQAGRRSFELRTDGSAIPTDAHNAISGRPPDATPGVDALKDRVLDILRADEFADWDQIVAGVTAGVEECIESTLQELQTEGRIQHSPRQGGYTVVENGR